VPLNTLFGWPKETVVGQSDGNVVKIAIWLFLNRVTNLCLHLLARPKECHQAGIQKAMEIRAEQDSVCYTVIITICKSIKMGGFKAFFDLAAGQGTCSAVRLKDGVSESSLPIANKPLDETILSRLNLSQVYLQKATDDRDEKFHGALKIT
jgi:hypothetical protein